MKIISIFICSTICVGSGFPIWDFENGGRFPFDDFTGGEMGGYADTIASGNTVANGGSRGGSVIANGNTVANGGSGGTVVANGNTEANGGTGSGMTGQRRKRSDPPSPILTTDLVHNIVHGAYYNILNGPHPHPPRTNGNIGQVLPSPALGAQLQPASVGVPASPAASPQ